MPIETKTQRRLPDYVLDPGFELPGAMLDSKGHVLLDRGARLSAADVSKLKRRAIYGLYGGDDWPDEFFPEAPASETAASQDSPAASGEEADSDGGRVLSVDMLQSGMQLSEKLFDQNGVLLLAAGTTITTRFLDLLRRRNLTTVRLGAGPEKTPAVKPSSVRRVSVEESLALSLAEPIPARSLMRFERPRQPLAIVHEEAERGLELHASASERVLESFDRLLAGRRVLARDVHESLHPFIEMIDRDMDILPLIVGTHVAGGEYLHDHSVSFSLMAMSVSAQLGWNAEQLKEIGAGTLLQDVGMAVVPNEIRMAARPLTRQERVEMERHVEDTMARLELVDDLPDAARFVAYQSHERCDCSGYPKKRSSGGTHPFAKVAAIADAYSAMSQDRPYRPAMLPYDAMHTLLGEAHANKYDTKFVRAFLDATSVFPIGSGVVLDDGTQARVVRANPGLHTRPVIETCNEFGRSAGLAIDLTREVGRYVASLFVPALCE